MSTSNFWHDFLLLIGRVCIGVLFLWAGGTKLLHWQSSIHIMKSRQMPLVYLLLPLGIAMQIFGGLSILVGFYARIGVLILIAFLIPALIKFHDFWHFTGEYRITEKTFFMKDIALLGGLLLILACGAGHFAVN